MQSFFTSKSVILLSPKSVYIKICVEFCLLQRDMFAQICFRVAVHHSWRKEDMHAKFEPDWSDSLACSACHIFIQQKINGLSPLTTNSLAAIYFWYIACYLAYMSNWWATFWTKQYSSFDCSYLNVFFQKCLLRRDSFA